jgi:glycosyltransferase involved in cell wall biosynthesis
MQDTVASHISLSNTPTHPLHYGFDREDFFGEVDASSGAILSDLQAEPEGPVLLNVSTYAVQKNLKTLVKSLPALVEAYPELTLVTTTSRSQTSDKAQYDALQRWAERHDVDDHWLELGYVPHEQLATVYQAADLFVFPSFTESFGHSLVEAMASGLPVVASATDVHREVCGEAATYFDTFNASECADTIQAVLQAPERRASMRAQSLQRAEEFSWEGYTARLATILREVVRNG